MVIRTVKAVGSGESFFAEQNTANCSFTQFDADDALLGPGRIGYRFEVNAGVEFNVSGGIIGENFDGNFGSEINVSGGIFGSNFGIRNVPGQISGGTFDSASINPFQNTSEDIFTISGGSFGRGFIAGNAVELVGGEFRLNGSEFEALAIHLISTPEASSTSMMEPLATTLQPMPVAKSTFWEVALGEALKLGRGAWSESTAVPSEEALMFRVAMLSCLAESFS